MPAGQVATIVTTLVMEQRPTPRPLPPSPLSLKRWKAPAPERYRALFRRVGAPWLWFSRLAIDDAALAAVVHDARVEIHAVLGRSGVEVGMLELDFRRKREMLLSYFALVPELTGQGHGRWLMAQAIALGWRPGIESARVETCTLDHPRALGFYRACGFAAIRRTMETFADPRLTGILPRDVAPHIPLIDV